MLLSIIIPVYNVERYVERCVRSCELQDIPQTECEVIVVNDESPDNSLRVVERVAKDFTNIKVISQPNGGLSAARNTGMRHAQGDYYMFVDSDDWIKENCLGQICRKLRDERPDVLCICAANVVNDKLERRFSFQDEQPIIGRELLRRGVSPCAPFGIWASSLFKKYELSFYEGIYHEDSELTPQAYYFAEKVSFLNDVIYYVRQNPTSITRTINPKKSYDLVSVVCANLARFADRVVQDEYKYLYYDRVGECLNSAIFHILSNDKKEQDKLNELIYDNRCLIQYMKKSTVLKYRLEAFLFDLFPRHYVRIYKMLKLKL